MVFVTAYDYIVVGAGSAGAIVAARLAEDSARKVLLIEAGGHGRSRFLRWPGMNAIVHQVPQLKKRFDWGYKTTPQPNANNRQIVYTRGRVLGGSSSVNGMLYIRGHRNNYDQWAAAGCAGWDFRSLLPHFNRFESHGEPVANAFGTDGPIGIERKRDVQDISRAFIESASQVLGVPKKDDINLGDNEGAAVVHNNIRKGIRQSTAECFLRNAPENLTIKTDAQVLRVVLQGDRCVGVELNERGQSHVVQADREVVLSAGAVGSPQLLMLSGIGPEAHLQEHSIDVNVSSPGVGQNFHDHPFVPLVFRGGGNLHRGSAFHILSGIMSAVGNPETWFNQTFFDAVAFHKTDPARPDTDIQFHALPWSYPAPNQDEGVKPRLDTNPCISVMCTLVQPDSRGTLRLASNDPRVAPLIDPAFLVEPSDHARLLGSIKALREIAKSGPLADLVDQEIEPGAEHASDEAIADVVADRVMTTYHPVGSCKMGVDKMSVVDPELRVIGVRGLRVADASIMPTITSGNTNAPSMMIGEKCASLMAQS